MSKNLLEKFNFRSVLNASLKGLDACYNCEHFEKREYYFDYCKELSFHFNCIFRSPFDCICKLHKRDDKK